MTAPRPNKNTARSHRFREREKQRVNDLIAALRAIAERSTDPISRACAAQAIVEAKWGKE